MITYHVRPGGDDFNCNGVSNINYPGGGPGTACAFKTPVRCWNKMDSGDTCLLHAGTYFAPGDTNCPTCNEHGLGFDLGGRTDTALYGPQDGPRCSISPPTGYPANSCIQRCCGGSLLLPKIIRGAPGEAAIIRHAGSPEALDGNTMTVEHGYAKVSNLVIYGRVQLDQGTGYAPPAGLTVEVTQNVFMCPGGSCDGNLGSLYTNHKANMDEAGAIWVHDNLFMHTTECNPLYRASSWGICAGGACCSVGTQGWRKPAFHHFYALSGAIIENNDYVIQGAVQTMESDTPTTVQFTDSVGLKACNQDVQIRKNYIDERTSVGAGASSALWDFNNYSSVDAGATGVGDCSGNGDTGNGFHCHGNNSWYQNLILGSNAGIKSDCQICRYENWYNNTIIGADACITHGNGGNAQYQNVGMEWFNNICVNAPVFVNSSGSAATLSNTENMQWWDNNLYYTSTTGTWSDAAEAGSPFSTLADWKATLATPTNTDESSSKSTDPLFMMTPAWATYSLSDSSPARTGGRGTPYSDVMGAWITGGETIGCSFDPRCHGYKPGVIIRGGGDVPGTGTIIRAVRIAGKVS